MSNMSSVAIKKNAIVSLVTSEDFVIGAQVMVHSLLQNNPQIKQLNNINTYALVTNNISNKHRIDLIKSGFDFIIEIDHIPNPTPSSLVHVSSWIDVGFTKLRIWSLIQFNQILYIDADCIVINDILHLFLNNKYNNISFAASPDVFPPDNFNAGVMLIKPDINTFNLLLNEMSFIASYDGGDTGFLNKTSLFNNWYLDGYRLHFGYNAQRIMHWFTKKKPDYWNHIQSKLIIIHYSSSPKPWNIKPSKRICDKVEIIWHKYWLSLMQYLNMNLKGNIIYNQKHSDVNINRHAIDYHLDLNELNKTDFNVLMTDRSIEFGRIYQSNSKDEAIKFEKTFLLNFEKRFYKFRQLLSNKYDNDNDNKSDFVFGNIPKIIHQIWLGPNPIPKQYKLWSKTWKLYHKNWKYMLWTDKTLKTHNFQWKSNINQSLFNIAGNYGEKSDILRLEILYKYGGIYVDFDFECIQSLNIFDYNYIDNMYSFIFGFSNTGLLEINNAMICCKPQHDVLIEIWKSIEIVCNDNSSQNTIIRTGPIQLSRCIMNIYSKYESILIFPTKFFYPFPNNMRRLPIKDRFVFYNDMTFGVHHWGVSWNKKLKNDVTVNDNNNNDIQIEKNDKNDNKTADEKSNNTSNNPNTNIVNTIMNSNNIALQSRIMSFLQQ